MSTSLSIDASSKSCRRKFVLRNGMSHSGQEPDPKIFSKLVRRNVNESVIVPNIIFNVENKIVLMLYNLSNIIREYKSYFFA